MPCCQNFGTEVPANFCPNCGLRAGAVPTAATPAPAPQPDVVYVAPPVIPGLVIHKNAVVKPRYNTPSIVIAGWLGLACLIMTLAFFIYGMLIVGGTTADMISFAVATAVCAGLTFLAYLPGISTILKRTPKGEVARTLGSFFVKSLLFFFAWGISVAFTLYLFGILFKVWRFGLWASRPNNNQYTAFVDGKKIAVTRYYDDLPDYGPRGTWVYMDANGEYYRPAV